jgi:hypothetical protein
MLSTLASFRLGGSLPLKAAETSAYLRHHPLHHLPTEGTVRPRLVALDTNVDAGIEHNGDGQGVRIGEANSVQLLRSAGGHW